MTTFSVSKHKRLLLNVTYAGDSDLVPEEQYEEITALFVEGIPESEEVKSFSGMAKKIEKMYMKLEGGFNELTKKAILLSRCLDKNKKAFSKLVSSHFPVLVIDDDYHIYRPDLRKDILNQWSTIFYHTAKL